MWMLARFVKHARWGGAWWGLPGLPAGEAFDQQAAKEKRVFVEQGLHGHHKN